MRALLNVPAATQAEVEGALTQGQPLAYRRIGKLHLANRRFHHLVDFSSAVFDAVTFEEVVFEAGISCRHAVFLGDASFQGCTFGRAFFRAARFRGKADFAMSVFSYADFWRALFSGLAGFKSIKVGGENGKNEPPGEANFSFAGFRDEANFFDGTFHGPTYFVGTRFQSKVKFDQARFLGSVGFVSQPEWACLVRDDIQDLVEGDWPGAGPKEIAALGISPQQLMNEKHGLFTELVRVKVLQKSEEQLDDAPPEHVEHAEFTGKLSPDQIRQYVQGTPFGEKAAALFEILRQPLTGPIFRRDINTPVLICGVTFAEQGSDAPHFRSADLGACFFGALTRAKTGLTHLRFEAVTWDEQPMLLGRRAALADERYVNTTEDRKHLREQYQELAATYRAAHDPSLAEQFRYGAMEMERRNGDAWRSFHKYLNGYHTSFLLPAFWFALFLLVIFPAIYLVLGTVATIPEAVAHSLLLSKFVSGETAPAQGTLELIVRAAEALVVGACATAAAAVYKQKLGLKESSTKS
jgi:uncharacterized protein YjbI with pentapeptide repeats